MVVPEAPDPAAVPWALQVVLRVERATPPTWTTGCEAVAGAVVRLLGDDRARPGGDWHDDLVTWRSRQIRKVVRRARGAAWHRACALPGAPGASGSAEAWALPPQPVDDVPRELAVLQVGGTDLEDPQPRRDVEPPAVGVLVAVTPHVTMSAGKAAAQCAHAAQLAWEALDDASRAAWAEAGGVVRVARPPAATWERLVAGARVTVRDAGYTEIPPGTCTTVAVWR